jgi:hypothetical protein
MTATPAESGSPRTLLRAFPFVPLEERRRQDRERHRLFRARRQIRRGGGVVCELHVGGATLRGLQRLGLVAEDEHDPATVAAAVCYLLQSTVYELGSIVQRLTPDER